MAIEDTFGYRFVRISLVLLNCLVLVRLVSLLLQYSHVFEPTFVLFVLLVGSNFLAAIVGAIREHRIAVLITGSLTLIMFLSLLFTNKENKNINVSLFTLLAIAAQSLIFSEMLKERQLFAQRQNLEIFAPMNSHGVNANQRNRSGHTPLAAVVVYQPPGSTRGQTGGIFMVDPILGTELPKDPPPSYFSANCPPPKYEDAIKLDSANTPQIVSANVGSSSSTNNNDQTVANQNEQPIPASSTSSPSRSSTGNNIAEPQQSQTTSGQQP